MPSIQGCDNDCDGDDRYRDTAGIGELWVSEEAKLRLVLSEKNNSVRISSSAAF